MKEYSLHAGKKTVILMLKASAVAVMCSIAIVILVRYISATTEKIVGERDEFAAISAQYSALDRSERDWETVKGAREKMEAMLPTIDTVPAVEDFLTGAAAKTNILLSLTFAPLPRPSATGPLEELDVTLRMEGGVGQLLSFFTEVENAPYFIALKNTSLTFEEGGALRTEASGVIYLKKESL